jgi:hypothetical protein
VTGKSCFDHSSEEACFGFVRFLFAGQFGFAPLFPFEPNLLFAPFGPEL